MPRGDQGRPNPQTEQGCSDCWVRQPLSVSGCNCWDYSLHNEHNAKTRSCFSMGVAQVAEELHRQKDGKRPLFEPELEYKHCTVIY